MKPMYVVAAGAFTVAVGSVAFLISAGSVVWTLKALPQEIMRDLSSTFSIFLDHKFPIIITLAVLAAIQFVRRVPMIGSR